MFVNIQAGNVRNPRFLLPKWEKIKLNVNNFFSKLKVYVETMRFLPKKLNHGSTPVPGVLHFLKLTFFDEKF